YLFNRDRRQCCYPQKQKVWFLHRDVSVNILTQGELQLKTQSIGCIGSLKLMECQNQSNHVCLKSDHMKMTVLHTLLDQHKEQRPHLTPHSPDINPCDSFLWGFLKEQVFR
ncbi:hypothetical protein C0J52_12126, partial [Blattella germanica]